MRKSDAIAILLANADEIRAAGVAHLSLFGSVARDEAGPDSDVDLVIEGPPERPITLLSMARAEAVLERLLGRRVDLTAKQGLAAASRLRERIEADVVPVF
jgi:predicted nucleotidyltransferase